MHNTGRHDIGQFEQRASRGFINGAVDRDGRKSLTTLCQSRLVILGDVHVAFAEQRADATDDPGHVMVGEDEQRLLRVDIDVKGADARQSRHRAFRGDAGHRELLHATGQRHFDGTRVGAD